MALPVPTTAHHGGSGSPMVLLHGVNSSWRVWQGLFPRLEAEHEIWAPTLAGHRGGAPVPPGRQVDARYLLDALEAGMDEVGFAEAHLVGNSLGGWLALALAARGRGLSVTAFSPAGAWRRRRDFELTRAKMLLGARLAHSRRVVALLRHPAVRRALLKPVAVHGDRIPYETVVAMMDDLRENTTLLGVLDGFRRDGVARLDVPADCPVELVWGDQDTTLPFPNWGRPMLDVVPAAHLSFLPGAGHVPMLDRPDVVTDIVLRTAAKA